MNRLLYFGIVLNILLFIAQAVYFIRFSLKLPRKFTKGKFEIISKSDGYCDAHIQVDSDVHKGDYILMEVSERQE